MTLRLLVATLLISMHLNLPAESIIEDRPLFETPASPEALAELQRMFNAEGKNKDALEAAFEQTRTIAVLTHPLVSSGRFYFFPGKGICWDTRKPLQSIYLITENEIILKNSRGHETRIPQRKIPQLASMMQTMDELFSGSAEGLAQQFNLFLLKGEDDRWQLGLVPSRKKLQTMMSRIQIEGQGRYVSRFMLVENTGDKTDIVFSDHQALASPLPKEWHDALERQP